MSQEVRIDLDAEEVALEGKEIVGATGVLTVARIKNGTENGRSMVVIHGEAEGNKVAWVDMTALLFIQASAAVYGKLVSEGEIQYDRNQLVVLVANEKEKSIELSFEHAVRSAVYDLPHAKKLLHELKRLVNLIDRI